MEIRFFGVRGSIAVSGSRIGGNTACVEVTSQGERLILDAGTGIRTLGEVMMREGAPQKVTMFFSHLHWDHVQGFPFFTPAYLPTTSLTLYGPGANGAQALESTLSQQMRPPQFPVPLSTMRSKMTFGAALHGHTVEVGPFKVTPIDVPHPDGCMAYRVEADGHSFVYATDVELPERLTSDVARHFEGADALCLDAQYTPDEYEGKKGMSKKGWGHSTMMDAAKVAKDLHAGRLFLFHHDPAHADDLLEDMAQQARGLFPFTEPAREGQRMLLGRAAGA
ncbi:MBL fold metallo-hydrolase [Corallococcus sp. CA053C]|uniref:MBL fold metallo-hydrolase n=1 Tax=Corallococcus sp. CA053C TaxID=2316732 RepID=UPI000EA316FF|nr:MBL fold metallo-hydrolase [Corallococcus sp. CA053C]RKG89038.1 MBL fold metallo-hydrolase [Corallococcus sp. CA053C]